MNHSLKRLRSLVEQTEDPQVFFSSDVFNNALNGVAKIVSERYGNFPITVQTDWDVRENADVAYTDNKRIYINFGNKIAQCVKSIPDKFIMYMGFLGHELGHVLYTDFGIIKKQAVGLYNDHKWFPERPPKNTPYLEDFETYCFQNKIPFNFFIEVYKDVSNILEDRYVNVKMSKEWEGLFKQGIAFSQKHMWNLFSQYNAAASTGINGCINTMHRLLVLGKCDEKIMCQYPQLATIPSIEKKLRNEDNYLIRAKIVNEVFLLMWPEMKKMLMKNNQSSGQGKGQSSGQGEGQSSGQGEGQSSGQGEGQSSGQGEGQSSGQGEGQSSGQGEGQSSGQGEGQQAAQYDTSQTMSSSQSGSGTGVLISGSTSESSEQSKSPAKQNNGESKDASQKQNNNDTTGSSSNTEDKTDKDVLSNALDSFIKDKMRKEPEEIQKLQREQTAKEALDGCHKNVRFTLTEPAIGNSSTASYDNAFYDLKRVSKRTQQAIASVFEERLNGVFENGLLFGNRVNPAASAARDGRVFRKKTMPDDQVDIAVSLLVDESGSMASGSPSRISKAKEMAMLVEDFCRGLHIPVSIVGHRVSGGVKLSQYVDYEDTDRKGRLRLMQMHSGGCNRDGFALNYCVKRLLERAEENRLMIVVSDGKPNDTNYGGEVAYEDLRKIKQECKRKGIILIVAAIGSDKKQIKYIYGNSFLDISDINTLPVKIVSVIKQFI